MNPVTFYRQELKASLKHFIGLYSLLAFVLYFFILIFAKNLCFDIKITLILSAMISLLLTFLFQRKHRHSYRQTPAASLTFDEDGISLCVDDGTCSTLNFSDLTEIIVGFTSKTHILFSITCKTQNNTLELSGFSNLPDILEYLKNLAPSSCTFKETKLSIISFKLIALLNLIVAYLDVCMSFNLYKAALLNPELNHSQPDIPKLVLLFTIITSSLYFSHVRNHPTKVKKPIRLKK